MGKFFKFLAILSVLLFSISGLVTAHDSDEDEYIPLGDVEDGNPNIKNIQYDYFNNKQSYPEYDLVFNAMAATFKNSYADKSRPEFSSPMIGIGEYDLNGDNINEIIAFPIESMEYGNVLCGMEELCPHYILDVSGKNPRTIGILRAFAVDRGEDIKGGYWTLNAYTKQDDPKNFSYHELYVFDKKSKKYTRRALPPAGEIGG